MKKLLVLLLIPFFAFSQTNPDREYWQTNKWTPKEGMNAEFEAGVAKKTDKFNSTAETSMATYQIITGQDQGKYMRVMGNRESSAFDEDNTAELAYWGKHVMPYVESNDGNIRWWRIKGLCLNWDNDLPPARFVQMTTYTLKSENRSDFFRFWRNNIELQKELGYTGIRGLFMLETGGKYLKPQCFFFFGFLSIFSIYSALISSIVSVLTLQRSPLCFSTYLTGAVKDFQFPCLLTITMPFFLAAN